MKGGWSPKKTTLMKMSFNNMRRMMSKDIFFMMKTRELKLTVMMRTR
jgi:hypothetical protein